MRSEGVGLMVLLALAVLALPGRARACDPFFPSPHMIDPAAVGVDTTPPQLDQPQVTGLHRIDNDAGPGCGGKCGWDHGATLINVATDDMTTVDRIGYRLTPVAGSEPRSNTWHGQAIDGTLGGMLMLFWDSDDDFDFTLQVIAIDAAGNESAPQTVRLHGDSGGCSVSRGRANGLETLVAVALALAALSFRVSRQRGKGVWMTSVHQPSPSCDGS